MPVVFSLFPTTALLSFRMALPFKAIFSLIPFISSIYPLLSIIPGSRASHLVVRANTTSAWNGRLVDKAPDRYSETHFTPYYVPTGSVSLDDIDPSINYTPSGGWLMVKHPDLVGHTMHTALMAGAKAELVFVGIGELPWRASECGT